MPLRPFPYPIRGGVDICVISRILRHVNNSPKEYMRFLKKLMTPRELEYFIRQKPYQLSHDASVARRHMIGTHLAGRWAAKEAALKAVKPRVVSRMDIEIWKREDGEPFAVILDQPSPAHHNAKSNGSGEILSNPVVPIVPPLESVHGQIARLSISHDGDYACAVVLAVEESGPSDVGGEAAARLSLT